MPVGYGHVQFIRLANAQSCLRWIIATANSGTTAYQYSYALKMPVPYGHDIVPPAYLMCLTWR